MCLDFSYHILMVGSRFDPYNMKAQIHPAVVQVVTDGEIVQGFFHSTLWAP